MATKYAMILVRIDDGDFPLSDLEGHGLAAAMARGETDMSDDESKVCVAITENPSGTASNMYVHLKRHHHSQPIHPIYRELVPLLSQVPRI